MDLKNAGMTCGIEKICVDINLDYRNIIKIEKDGIGTVLHYDKTKGYIVFQVWSLVCETGFVKRKN